MARQEGVYSRHGKSRRVLDTHFPNLTGHQKKCHTRPRTLVRSKPKVRHRRGKTVSDEVLQNRRDSILWVIGTWWDAIGWRLARAKNHGQLQKAFRPLRRDPSSFQVAPLFRTTVEPATKVQRRDTKRLLREAVERVYDKQQSHIEKAASHQIASLSVGAVLRETKEYLSASSEKANDKSDEKRPDLDAIFRSLAKLQLIETEVDRRNNELDRAQREFDAARVEERSLQEKVADQEAHAAQAGLLKFKQRGYAHNPNSVACALAGHPEIGCRRSFTLCSKLPRCQFWPLYQYEVFGTIQEIWNARKKRASTNNIVEVFKERILKLPMKVKPKASGPRLTAGKIDNYVRADLCNNWWYLERAIRRVLQHDVLHVQRIPYLILTLSHRIKRYPGPGDELRAEMNRISYHAHIEERPRSARRV